MINNTKSEIFNLVNLFLKIQKVENIRIKKKSLLVPVCYGSQSVVLRFTKRCATVHKALATLHKALGINAL